MSLTAAGRMDRETAELLAELTLVDLIKPVAKTVPLENKLSPKERNILQKLQKAFNDNKKNETTQAEFDSVYDEAENPYQLALKLHVQGVNFRNCKASSFNLYILEALNNYSRTHPDKHKLLDDSLKLTAFQLANKDPNSSYFKIVAEAFRFPDSPHLFDEHIRTLMKEHEYIAAARFASYCRVMHEDFIVGFLVPISFNRHNIATLYDYLEWAKCLQNPLMHLLDSMLTKDAHEKCQLMMDVYKYRDIPRENLTYEYLRANIPKLQKRLQTDPSVIPNSTHLQTVGAITFWVRRFAMREADYGSFYRKINGLIKPSDGELQLVLLNQLLHHNMELQCLNSILHFNIDIDKLPEYIRNKLDYYYNKHQQQIQQNQQQQRPCHNHHNQPQYQHQQQSLNMNININQNQVRHNHNQIVPHQQAVPQQTMQQQQQQPRGGQGSMVVGRSYQYN